MRRSTNLTLLAILALAACGQNAATAEDGKDPVPPGTPAKSAESGLPADGAPPKTTESGLVYSVLAAGEPGLSPKMGDPVIVSYTGWLLNGKVFDASERHGGPATFTCGQLVPGWNEALQMMGKGAKWKITLKPELGYGANPAGDIPPNSTLVFVLELHDFATFVKPDAAKSKKTASGLIYETVSPGVGEPPAADDSFELRMFAWNGAGKLLPLTRTPGELIKVSRSNLTLPFLKEAPDLLRAGSVIRCEVAPLLGFGAEARGPDLPANSTTYWQIEMTRILRPLAVPKFAPPPESELTTLPSGLKYKIVEEGKGSPPSVMHMVRTHYSGWLLDGKNFDNSYQRGEPMEFQLAGVIRGWQEGFGLLKPGSKAWFVIPPDLAYGAKDNGVIPPNSTLAFYVEFISSKDP